METAKALQEEGKVFFSQKKYKEALRSYAAALSHLKDSDTEKEQAAALRANRSLCCLQLGDNQLALAEAEQAKALSPAWPKAHFRVATALKACGRLGEARLATCEALRMAPKDGTIQALQKELRQELFADCSALGEALDALEDFNRSPEETKRSAQVVKDMLLSDVKEDVLRAFMASAGSKTIFRRQNAMGENWQEEARNGTMSLLSEITKAGPQLEEELVRLNQEAAAMEGSCSTAGCSDPHTMSKAQEAQLDRQKVAPPPAPPALPEEEAFSGISKSRRKRKGGLPKDTAEAAKVAEPSKVCLSLPTMSTKATELLFSFGPLRALAVAAAVAQDWAKAATSFGDNDADSSIIELRQASWLRWAESLCPGVADLQIASPMMGKQLLQHLAAVPEKVEGSKVVTSSMGTWSFLLEIWRDDRRLWATCLTGAHALPGFLEEAEAEKTGHRSLPLWSAYPTCYERMDLLLPGEARRSTLAGLVASLGSDRAGALRGKALAVAKDRTLALPLALHAGSRFSKEVSMSSSGPLQLVLGLGARNVLPSPKAQCPVGSLELLSGLAFAGADGRWLDPATISALLSAMS